MNVQEMINYLNTFPLNMEVKITLTDPTDWRYTLDVDKEDVLLGSPYGTDMEIPEDLYMEDNSINPKYQCVLIDLGVI